VAAVGLGVAIGKPAFVVGLDAASGAVRIGDESELLASSARVEEPRLSQAMSRTFSGGLVGDSSHSIRALHVVSARCCTACREVRSRALGW
jgi:hypothetical protein